MEPEPSGQAGPDATKLASRVSWGMAVVGFLFFLLLAGVTTAMLRSRAPFAQPVEQPIAFNHRVHVKDNDLACSACHASYEKEAFSGLPGRDECEFCHAEPAGTSEAERKLVSILEAGSPLEWQRLFRQPAHVFYSHRRHVVSAQIECSVCHGSIGESVKPPERASPMSMDDCIACHERTGVSTACTACHR